MDIVKINIDNIIDRVRSAYGKSILKHLFQLKPYFHHLLFQIKSTTCFFMILHDKQELRDSSEGVSD